MKSSEFKRWLSDHRGNIQARQRIAAEVYLTGKNFYCQCTTKNSALGC